MPPSPTPARVDFTAVYRDHWAFVCRRLHKWGVEPRDIEDAAHEVFLVVHRKLPLTQEGLPVVPWLAAIAHHVASDWRRKLSRRPKLEDAPPLGHPLDDAAPDALQVAANHEAMEHVLAALDLLPQDQRMVFVLHDMESHSAPAVAHALGIPVNTVYSRLRLGRQRFTQAIHAIRKEGRHEQSAR